MILSFIGGLALGVLVTIYCLNRFMDMVVVVEKE